VGFARAAGVVLFCSAVSCGPAPAPTGSGDVHADSGPSPLGYRVRFDPEQGVLEARLCTSGGLPARLVPVRPEGAHYLRWATGPSGQPLPRDGTVLEVPEAGSPGCVAYGVDLALAARSSRHVTRQGGDWLTSSGVWLWRPERLAPGTRVELRFELPRGVRALAPWPEGEGASLALPPSALHLHAYVALGRLTAGELREGGVTLRYARLGGGGPSDDAIRRWLGSALRAAATIGASPCADRIVAVLVPAPPGPDPVPFGMLHRGGDPSIMFLVREGAEEGALVDDWVATHELAHLALPLVDRQDAWLPEGVATYYQEVARARAGILSPLDAFRRMDAGFERGRRAGTGRPLAEESASLPRTGAYARVYWAGAAFALEADMMLRAHHGSSLDAVLAALPLRRGPGSGPWRAEALLREMDRAAGTVALSELARAHLARSDFPDIEALFARLGLVRDAEGALTTVDDAPLAPLRDAITARAK
jgi:hypothetical protein